MGKKGCIIWLTQNSDEEEKEEGGAKMRRISVLVLAAILVILASLTAYAYADGPAPCPRPSPYTSTQPYFLHNVGVTDCGCECYNLERCFGLVIEGSFFQWRGNYDLCRGQDIFQRLVWASKGSGVRIVFGQPWIWRQDGLPDPSQVGFYIEDGRSHEFRDCYYYRGLCRLLRLFLKR